MQRETACQLHRKIFQNVQTGFNSNRLKTLLGHATVFSVNMPIMQQQQQQQHK